MLEIRMTTEEIEEIANARNFAKIYYNTGTPNSFEDISSQKILLVNEDRTLTCRVGVNIVNKTSAYTHIEFMYPFVHKGYLEKDSFDYNFFTGYYYDIMADKTSRHIGTDPSLSRWQNFFHRMFDIMPVNDVTTAEIQEKVIKTLFVIPTKELNIILSVCFFASTNPKFSNPSKDPLIIDGVKFYLIDEILTLEQVAEITETPYKSINTKYRNIFRKYVTSKSVCYELLKVFLA